MTNVPLTDNYFHICCHVACNKKIFALEPESLFTRAVFTRFACQLLKYKIIKLFQYKNTNSIFSAKEFGPLNVNPTVDGNCLASFLKRSERVSTIVVLNVSAIYNAIIYIYIYTMSALKIAKSLLLMASLSDSSASSIVILYSCSPTIKPTHTQHRASKRITRSLDRR